MMWWFPRPRRQQAPAMRDSPPRLREVQNLGDFPLGLRGEFLSALRVKRKKHSQHDSGTLRH